MKPAISQICWELAATLNCISQAFPLLFVLKCSDCVVEQGESLSGAVGLPLWCMEGSPRSFLASSFLSPNPGSRRMEC